MIIQITTPIAAAAISVVTLALIVRFISTFVLSFALGLSCKEQFIVAVANLSKGSIQVCHTIQCGHISVMHS